MYNNLMCSMLICELRFIQIKNLYINTKIKGEYRLKYYTTRSYPGNCGSVIRPPGECRLECRKPERNCGVNHICLLGHCLQDEYVPSGQHERLVGTTRSTGVTVCACMRFAGVIRSGYLVLANQQTSSEGQGSRDLGQTRVEPY